jgi:hypothetical protein
MIGILTAATILEYQILNRKSMQNKDNVYTYNAEGSVFWDPHINEIVTDTVGIVTNHEYKYKAEKALGIIGVAQLGMVRMMEAAK